MTAVTDLLIARPDRLKLYTFAELVNHPPAPWQVRGMLREQSVCLLYGRRGCFKSFVALDLACAIATGTPWHGHEVTQPGLVPYIAAEGGGGMVQRGRAWLEQHGLMASQVPVHFVTEPALVMSDSEDIDILIERIRDTIGWVQGMDPNTGIYHAEPVAHEWPKLIVVDTLARCFHGDENKQEDMGQFIQGIDRLKMEFNCSILILHHTGRDESHERGSTVLGGACDTIFRLDATKSRLLLTCEKMKDGREPDPVHLSHREVSVTRRPSDDKDEVLTSVIIEDADGPDDADTVCTRDIMVALLAAAGRATWTEWWEQAQEHSVSKATFNRCLISLTEKGEIIKENKHYRLT